MSDVVWDKWRKHNNHYKIDEDTRQLVQVHIFSHFQVEVATIVKTTPIICTCLQNFQLLECIMIFLEKHDPEYLKLEEESKHKKWCHEVDQDQVSLQKPLVSEYFYHNIFVTEFNIQLWISKVWYLWHMWCLQKANRGLYWWFWEELFSTWHELHKNKLPQDGYNALKQDQELRKQSWALLSQMQQSQSAS